MSDTNLRDWLANLPCVIERRVIIDVRGPWPIAFIGFKSSVITCKDDMYWFVANNLD